MVERINYEKGIVYRGNWHHLKRVMKRAMSGESVTTGFLGGSITQGSLASEPSSCYAYLVYEWWKNKFPEAGITYVNAGIGGTSSQFGVARAEEDLLASRPDFVVVEFSVNDENTPFFQETYEGLVRRICGSAAVLLHNIYYETGDTAEQQHSLVGKHYDLPCLSMKDSVYAAMKQGAFLQEEITPDGLHPNDKGHALLAGLVIHLLEKVYAEAEKEEAEAFLPGDMPLPLTDNAYEHSRRYRNINCKPLCQGFTADTRPQEHITEIFRLGWVGEKAGDSIVFEEKGSEIAIQYRKSVIHPACRAVAIVDGKEDAPIELDGNFQEDWGDCLYLQNLVVHGENRTHQVKITVVDGEAGKDVPFYLISLIVSEK